MASAKSQFYFLLILLGTISIVTYFIFQPFIYSIVLAMVFAVVFHPIYARILKRVPDYPSVAALITTLLVLSFILVPLVFLGFQIFFEAQQLYIFIIDGGIENFLGNFRNLSGSFAKYLPAAENFSLEADQYVKQGLGWLIQNTSFILSNLLNILISFFIFLISFYYLLKDGKKLKEKVMSLSPLEDSADEEIFSKLEIAIGSVMKGGLMIALIQGILASIGFLIFGVPNVVLWGMTAAIAALIPGIGTALILIPAIIYLFLIGNMAQAVGLGIWSLLVVGLIDNFLAPKLVNRGTKLHPLIIFLAVIGGIGYFGPLGFLLGPLTMSLLFSLLHIYSGLVKNQ